MNYYLLVQFLFILGGASFFLFNLSNLSGTEQLTIAVLITVSVMSTGFLFEAHPWAAWAEYARLLITGLVLLVLIRETSSFPALAISISFIVLLSCFWVYRNYHLPILKTGLE